ncbi:hypothetical protein KCU65_g1176, partial [Aureobasidium melanogenum]
MSNASEAQAGILRPLFWAHVSTDDAGFSSILHMRESAHISSNEQNHGPDSPTASFTPISTDSTASSLEATEAGYPVQIRIQRTPQKRKPVLRRCCSPITESLREIRQRQSEEDLRNLYEAQTLAYLNDAIQF